jgi:hypothetical protein
VQITREAESERIESLSAVLNSYGDSPYTSWGADEKHETHSQDYSPPAKRRRSGSPGNSRAEATDRARGGAARFLGNRLIKDFELLTLHDDARDVFANAILRPPAPNAAARKAAQRYKEQMGVN